MRRLLTAFAATLLALGMLAILVAVVPHVLTAMWSLPPKTLSGLTLLLLVASVMFLAGVVARRWRQPGAD